MPKMSIHDWFQGPNKPASDQGCFGLYLDGKFESTQKCINNNIIKKPTVSWSKGWENVKDQVYEGASWFAWIGNDDNKKIAIGINLDGWLPVTNKDATYDEVKKMADFMIESPDGTIQGPLEGGFYLAVSSTANPDDYPEDGIKYQLGKFVIWDQEE